MIRAFFYHLQLTLRLNFRSKQPLVYGYLVPVLFLVAFGALFRAGTPPLLHQMAQIITISALGGACFGMPTALVAERERGWWRRYRLLPRSAAPLLASTLVARLLLISSAAILQLILAHLIYGTPYPERFWVFCLAYGAVAWAFLGLGLLIAALATDVPAVQALGQCLFLPFIMIGGVGIPLIALPVWAQQLAAFLPGRYAVDALQAGISGEGGGVVLAMNLLALAATGAAAGVSGIFLFRWDRSPRNLSGATPWIALSLMPWIVVGLLSLRSGHWQPVSSDTVSGQPWVSQAQLEAIRFDGLPPDDGTVTPLSPPHPVLEPQAAERISRLERALGTWAPGRDRDPVQAVRSLLSVAAIADVAEDPLEGPIARSVLELLKARYSETQLEQALAALIIDPSAGSVRTSAEELALAGSFDEEIIRGRVTIYAAKALGRLRGALAD